MTYPSYLIHFNRLHDKKGRFTYGDGDGDGSRNDNISSFKRYDKKDPNKIRNPRNGHPRYEKTNTYKKIHLDDGKVSKNWDDSTRRDIASRVDTGNQLGRNTSSSKYFNTTQKSTMRTPGGGGGGSTGVVAYGGKPVAEDDDEEKKMIDRKYIDAGKALVDEYKKKLANTTMSKSLSKMMTLSTSNRSSGYRGQNPKGDKVKIRVGHQHDNS